MLPGDLGQAVKEATVRGVCVCVVRKRERRACHARLLSTSIKIGMVQNVVVFALCDALLYRCVRFWVGRGVHPIGERNVPVPTPLLHFCASCVADKERP